MGCLERVGRRGCAGPLNGRKKQGRRKAMNEQDGFRLEAAVQFGFQESGHNEGKDDDCYLCSQAQLIAFAKACERAGMYQAYGMDSRDLVFHRMLEIDAELAPILANAKEEQDMASRGYARSTECPDTWHARRDPNLCEGKTATEMQKDRLQELRRKFSEIYTIEQCGDAIRAILDHMVESV